MQAPQRRSLILGAAVVLPVVAVIVGLLLLTSPGAPAGDGVPVRVGIATPAPDGLGDAESEPPPPRCRRESPTGDRAGRGRVRTQSAAGHDPCGFRLGRLWLGVLECHRGLRHPRHPTDHARTPSRHPPGPAARSGL